MFGRGILWRPRVRLWMVFKHRLWVSVGGCGSDDNHSPSNERRVHVARGVSTIACWWIDLSDAVTSFNKFPLLFQQAVGN